jgi:hypothetical protein
LAVLAIETVLELSVRGVSFLAFQWVRGDSEKKVPILTDPEQTGFKTGLGANVEKANRLKLSHTKGGRINIDAASSKLSYVFLGKAAIVDEKKLSLTQFKTGTRPHTSESRHRHFNEKSI